MSRYDRVYIILCGLFITSLIVANVLVFKLFDIQLFGFQMTMVAGIIPYPITFLATDLISELYGAKRASFIVWVGFFCSIFMLLILYIGKIVPLSINQGGEIQQYYIAVFGQSARAIFASMVAYLFAQLIDVRLFHFFRRLTNKKHLWLRNNCSTMLSQLVDTVLVVSILFAGTLSFDVLLKIIISSYIFKLMVAAADTPLFYLGNYLFKDIILETERREAQNV